MRTRLPRFRLPTSVFFLEVAGPVQWRPGFYRSRYATGWHFRVLWLWFSFGRTPLSLSEWHRQIATGRIVWRSEDGA